ncbi:MAG TPA: helix-turn-helix domain-containing protein [Flavisolibacter sp.]|nr:helix-turn-helix domain-containing protein [Flavisolibacter sp.]
MLFVAGIGISFFLDFLLISKKGKTLADNILACWLFIIGIHLLFFYLYYTGLYFEHPWLMGIDIPLPLLHGPFLFLYTAALTNRLPGRKYFALLHFVPALLCYLYLVTFFMLPPDQKIFVYQNKGVGFETFMTIKLWAIIISGIVYVGCTHILLGKHRSAILNEYSYTDKINLKWMQYLVYGIAAIWLIVIAGTDELTFVAVVLFVLFIGYFGIKQVGIFNHPLPLLPANAGTNYGHKDPVLVTQLQEVLPIQHKEIIEPAAEPPGQTMLPVDMTSVENESSVKTVTALIPEDLSSDKKKYSKSGLSGTMAEQLHKQLTNLMEAEKLYTESELSLSDLARRLNTHPNYLSQVINEKEGKNLYDYVNTLRIEEFIKLVSQPHNQNLTLLSLAYECGFNSKSSFNRYFKKTTGQSPSEYLKQLHPEAVPE